MKSELKFNQSNPNAQHLSYSLIDCIYIIIYFVKLQLNIELNDMAVLHPLPLPYNVCHYTEDIQPHMFKNNFASQKSKFIRMEANTTIKAPEHKLSATKSDIKYTENKYLNIKQCNHPTHT